MRIDRMWIDDVEVDPQTYLTDHPDHDELDHLFCECSPDISLCGTDIEDDPVIPDDEEPEQLCVVCEDLDENGCPRCLT